MKTFFNAVPPDGIAGFDIWISPAFQFINIDLAGDSAATQSTSAPAEKTVQTPWMEIDDVFFEARGTAWALVHFFRAAQFDFAAVLADKGLTGSDALVAVPRRSSGRRS